MSRHYASNQATPNRRAFFRLNLYHMTVEVTVLGDLDDYIPTTTYQATIRDLSGGGISFYTKEPIIHTPDDILTVNFEVMDNIFFEQVSIVRYYQVDHEQYMYACQFSNINPYEQDKLIAVVFRMQASQSKHTLKAAGH
ncbi:flagellar brake protein [Paenibacillus albiflavus]|nr:PilZ domain-containing protein [Paenibacillus albiflavus]